MVASVPSRAIWGAVARGEQARSAGVAPAPAAPRASWLQQEPGPHAGGSAAAGLHSQRGVAWGCWCTPRCGAPCPLPLAAPAACARRCSSAPSGPPACAAGRLGTAGKMGPWQPGKQRAVACTRPAQRPAPRSTLCLLALPAGSCVHHSTLLSGPPGRGSPIPAPPPPAAHPHPTPGALFTCHLSAMTMKRWSNCSTMLIRWSVSSRLQPLLASLMRLAHSSSS